MKWDRNREHYGKIRMPNLTAMDEETHLYKRLLPMNSLFCICMDIWNLDRGIAC